jgi:hypothetical protein
LPTRTPLSRFHRSEVQTVSNNFKPKSSPDYDLITGKILQDFKNYFWHCLRIILACSPKILLCNPHAAYVCTSACLWIPPSVFCVPEPIFMKLGMYIMTP